MIVGNDPKPADVAVGLRVVLNGLVMQQWVSSSDRYWATTVECCNTQCKFLFAEDCALRVTKTNSESTTDPGNKESGQ